MKDPMPSDEGTADEPRQLGDFTLLRQLGAGSQAEVWEARQESLGRLVAIKLLPDQLTSSKERLQRFRREAEAEGRLSHPGNVSVYAIGEHEGTHFIVQELVPGGRTLSDMLDEARRLPELPRDWYRDVAGLFARVADALHAAHESGVVHRDVKPGNILLTEEGRPKLADFGLALVEDELGLSQTGDLLGTPFYMSPEQILGSRDGVDHRTDIFSAGASLYEALTLTRPFTGDRRQLMQAILQRDPVDPRRLHRNVPRDLAVICLKALEKQPARRFANASELAADLRRFLAGEPIHARPPGPLLRLAKWTHRHPRLSTAASVTVVAFAVVAWQLVQTSRARATTSEALINERLANEATAAALTEAENVVTLLEGVFGGSDPISMELEEIVHRLEVLDRGAAMVGLLEGNPSAQWRLMIRLGRGYLALGAVGPATDHIERAWNIAEKHFEEDDARRAMNLLDLSRLKHKTGEWIDAERLALDALTAMTAIHGAGKAETLMAVGELGLLYKSAGRPFEAEARLREYLEGCQRIAPSDEPQDYTVLAMHTLGTFLIEQGRLREAEELLLPAFEHVERLPELLAMKLQHSVAWLHDLLGREDARQGAAKAARDHDETAERLYREVLKREQDVLGEAHVDTLTTLNNLGSFYRERQRDELARPLLEQAVALFERTEGPFGTRTLLARNNLARLEYSANNEELAERIWRKIVEDDREHPQPNSRPVLIALGNLASLARDGGRLEEAEQLALELVQRTPADAPEAPRRRSKLAGIQKLRSDQEQASP
jgi:serine/threonine protein kinase